MHGEDEPVVVNTGPLIALAACGEVELIRKFHPRVIIPDAVMAELGRGAGRISDDFLCPEWIEVLDPGGPPLPLLRAYLDEGEAGVITLAVKLGVRLVVMDERRGRMIARNMGLTVTGSMGILLRAKKAGILPAVKPCLEAMRARGVWLSDRLMAAALAECEEG